jgi:hypothetical protein
MKKISQLKEYSYKQSFSPPSNNDLATVRGVGPASAADTVVSGLNDPGVVVGQFNDAATPAPFNYRAFSWTVAGGLRPMPGSGTSIACAINNRNQAVGSIKGAAFYGRAYRCSRDGTTLDLGPLPVSLSDAVAVNDGGMAVGYADVARPGVRTTAPNDVGDIAANLQATDDGGIFASTPFLWSAVRGRQLLALGGTARASVDALNNLGGMVGHIERGSADPAHRRAVLWQGMTAPVDLNDRLLRAPAGLVLYAGKAINDKGDILAVSNAGLVLLRPGTRRSDAPVPGPLGMVDAAVAPSIGARGEFRVTFTDTGPSETHKAMASVDDGCPLDAPVVREARGNGEIDVCHTFCRAGSITIKVKVTDRAGNATEVHRELTVVEAPVAGAAR